MLTAAVLIPFAVAVVLAASPRVGADAARKAAVATALAPLVIAAAAWLEFDASPDGAAFQLIEEAAWIPTLGVAWRLGVDGISLAVAAMTALLFAAAISYPFDARGRARQYYAWLLFLDAVSLGVFLALDLLLFYVFFDLSLVGMYFLIGRFGHGNARASALKFFVYTFAGSLALLLAILGLYLATEPPTFDMRLLIERQPLAGTLQYGNLVLLGFVVGFGIKTPLFPVHTWLPPTHVDAPGPASAILAGVLLKMGTFGLLRIPFSMMRETFARHALALGIAAVVSVLYGALVALAQSSMKRRIAYTSINHMGYAVLGIAAAGAAAGTEDARALALTGATVEMVAHGLITGALFLIAGSFWQRAEEYDLGAYGGLARRAPRLAFATTLAAFASLGLPALAGFIAEFQIFAGTFAVYPWLAGLALLGILITAALFLGMLQSLFFGELPPRWSDFPDLRAAETAALLALLALVVVIGVYPRWLLDVVDAAARRLTGAG